jgi:hypothetical protein
MGKLHRTNDQFLQQQLPKLPEKKPRSRRIEV